MPICTWAFMKALLSLHSDNICIYLAIIFLSQWYNGTIILRNSKYKWIETWCIVSYCMKKLHNFESFVRKYSCPYGNQRNVSHQCRAVMMSTCYLLSKSEWLSKAKGELINHYVTRQAKNTELWGRGIGSEARYMVGLHHAKTSATVAVSFSRCSSWSLCLTNNMLIPTK